MSEKRNNELKGVLIDEDTIFSLKEICHICGVHAEFINEMIEFSIIEPQSFEEELNFNGKQLIRIRKALHLQQDFNLNLPGLALSLDLLETIQELESKIQKLEHQLSAFHRNG